MKLSEQECAESLGYIWNLAIDEVDRRRIPYDDLRKSVKTLQKLIEEHFDNPSLEWEELKECNVVYDKEQKKFRLIEDLLENGKRIVFTNTIDSFIIENYEPNRFYRKEVKDVD